MGGKKITVFASQIEQINKLQKPVVLQMLQEVNETDIYSYIFDLQNFTTRFAYTQNCNQSAQYIYDTYSAFPGLIVESQYFIYNSYVLRNIIATLPGLNKTNKTIYIAGGHYDSMNGEADPWVIAPGADDDASGVSVALIAAQIMHRYKFEATIKFTAWTAEEIGLVGSDYYAARASASAEDIGAYLNFDMVGYDPFSAMRLNVGFNTASEWLADLTYNMNSMYNISLDIIRTASGTGSSDHASFWQYGYPAIMYIENRFNDYYHTSNDTVDKLNMAFAKKVAQLCIATLAELANVLPPGEGKIYLNKSAYKPNDIVEITLYDTDLNTNPYDRDFVSINVYSETEQAGESVVLLETDVNSSVFIGVISTMLSTPSASDGILQVGSYDNITAEYIEASPAGVRIARASIDGIPPVIQNVGVYPDVTSAIIRWETNEPASSMVYYSTSYPLDKVVSTTGKNNVHTIELINLAPETLYYFDVQSVDIAGNIKIDDNSGTHYGFTTLTGVGSSAQEGFVGYVKESDPTGNYFFSPDMHVGHGYQGTYHGAVQFDIPSVPQNIHILNATVKVCGKKWIYTGIYGQWNLRLLPSYLDANWQAASYDSIHTATPDATIPPTLTDTDLADGKWNTFYFEPQHFTHLQNRIDSGKISFRCDGPAYGYHLFTWHTGQSGDPEKYAPRLTIRFTTTSDFYGPVVTYIDVSPNPSYGAEFVELSAIISDDTTGNSTVVCAEFYMNVTGWLPMTPVDGIFDSITEQVRTKICIKNLPDGNYTLYIRGMDGCGNWGPLQQVVLQICQATIPEFYIHQFSIFSLAVIISIMRFRKCRPKY